MHVISPFLFLEYRHKSSSSRKAVYNLKVFFPHAASLGQAFAHCRRFSTAATRRCIARVAVLLLGVALSRPLPVIVLVGRYPTNKLIGRGPILKRKIFTKTTYRCFRLSGITPDFSGLCLTLGLVIHVLLTRSPVPSKLDPSTCMPYPRRQRSS